jgi:hypothetical protein
VEQWKSGADHNVRLHKGTVHSADACPVAAQRFTTCSPNAPEYAYYTAAILRNEILSDPPPKRSAEDVLFDYLEPEERKVYNDLARRIQKHFEELEIENSKRRDRRNVQPLTGLMQE